MLLRVAYQAINVTSAEASNSYAWLGQALRKEAMDLRRGKHGAQVST